MSENLIIPVDFLENEEDEDEDILPDAQQPVSIESELERFRAQWHQELASQMNKGVGSHEAACSGQQDVQNANVLTEKGPSVEEQAKFLFMQGVNSEQNGKLANAIQYYRRALQLVPDIESRIEEFKHAQAPGRDRTVSQSSNQSTESLPEEIDEEDDLDDLVGHFNRLRFNNKTNVHRERETSTTHVSVLPIEVIIHIFKWVITTDLDVQALENLAMVCRQFFICARDEQLWRLICLRIWGRHLGKVSIYGTYRNMYMERPHLRTNGCYISRCVYYREGEKGLDNLYKPFHFVEYFRYSRFFPDGQVLMLTTPDNPSVTVSKLKYRNANVQGTLRGYFRLVGDTVTCVMKRQKTDYDPNTYYKFKRMRRNNNNNNEDRKEEIFHAELTLMPAGKRPRSKLTWNEYSVQTAYCGQESIADFELTHQSYPPLLFSSVKSYTASSEVPLC